MSETIYFIRDLDEAIQFYTQNASFTLEQRYDWGFAVLSIDGQSRLGLMLESAWDREYPDDDTLPRPRLAIQTDDFSEEIHRLRALNVPMGTVQGTPGARQHVTYFDPDENPIFLWADPEEAF